MVFGIVAECQEEIVKVGLEGYFGTWGKRNGLLLRRQAGSPVEPENFMLAKIEAGKFPE